MVRARVVIGVNAGVILALGLALLVPLVLSLLYRDGSWKSFLTPAAVMIPLGTAGLWAVRQRSMGYVLDRDVYLSVTLAWVLAALLGGIPYVLEGTFNNLLDSTFESMSGFTTTGATLLAVLEAETPSILFWRSMTHWLGGLGIVVLFVAVAPTIGAGCSPARRPILGAHPHPAHAAHHRHGQGPHGPLPDALRGYDACPALSGDEPLQRHS